MCVQIVCVWGGGVWNDFFVPHELCAPEMRVARRRGRRAGGVLGVLLLPLCRGFSVVPAPQREAAVAPRFDLFCVALAGRWVRGRDERPFEVWRGQGICTMLNARTALACTLLSHTRACVRACVCVCVCVCVRACVCV